jgi:ribosomal protein L7/L12
MTDSIKKQCSLLIEGWNEGFNKVSFTKLLQQEMGASLSTAKDMTDRILEGKPVTVNVVEKDADRIASLAEERGAIVRRAASVVEGSCR